MNIKDPIKIEKIHFFKDRTDEFFEKRNFLFNRALKGKHLNEIIWLKFETQIQHNRLNEIIYIDPFQIQKDIKFPILCRLVSVCCKGNFQFQYNNKELNVFPSVDSQDQGGTHHYIRKHHFVIHGNLSMYGNFFS